MNVFLLWQYPMSLITCPQTFLRLYVINKFVQKMFLTRDSRWHTFFLSLIEAFYVPSFLNKKINMTVVIWKKKYYIMYILYYIYIMLYYVVCIRLLGTLGVSLLYKFDKICQYYLYLLFSKYFCKTLRFFF